MNENVPEWSGSMTDNRMNGKIEPLSPVSLKGGGSNQGIAKLLSGFMGGPSSGTQSSTLIGGGPSIGNRPPYPINNGFSRPSVNPFSPFQRNNVLPGPLGGLQSLYNRLGGIEGITSMVQKVRQYYDIYQQIKPMLSAFSSSIQNSKTTDDENGKQNEENGFNERLKRTRSRSRILKKRRKLFQRKSRKRRGHGRKNHHRKRKQMKRRMTN
jgi:hypothetical protein